MFIHYFCEICRKYPRQCYFFQYSQATGTYRIAGVTRSLSVSVRIEAKNDVSGYNLWLLVNSLTRNYGKGAVQIEVETPFWKYFFFFLSNSKWAWAVSLLSRSKCTSYTMHILGNNIWDLNFWWNFFQTNSLTDVKQ